MKTLSANEVSEILKAKSKSSYMSMYSSHFGGIITEPSLMMVPIDDHGFHRGDAVFEAIKFIDGRIYGLDEHLARLEKSAAAIELDLQKGIREILLQTIVASGSQTGLIRLYATRGPGGFTANPYDCKEPGLYIVITKFAPVPKEKYDRGVTAKLSKYLAKNDFYAQIKSLNYLQNVLMKKDAVDSGVDFTIAVDSKGFITEGSTENCAFISSKNEMLVPSFENTLRGITLTRVIEFAKGLVEKGELSGIVEKHIAKDEVFAAREMAFIGTTLDVLPVSTLDQKKIGTGQPGPIFQKLHSLILEDIANPKSKMNTAVS